MFPSFGRSGTVVGVGQKPESVPLVGRTNGGSGKTIPQSIIPERGQILEDLLERLAIINAVETWHVLEEGERWTELIEETGAFGPEPSGVASSTHRPAN